MFQYIEQFPALIFCIELRMWSLILLSACAVGWDQTTSKTYGSQTTTRFLFPVMQNMHENCLEGPNRDFNFIPPWVRPCWLPLELLEDMSNISAGFPNGIWNGQSLHTQDDRCRLRVCPDFRLRKMNCIGGVIYISRAGCLTFGREVATSVYHRLTLTVWISPRPPRQLPHRICQGKTGRRWRPRMWATCSRRRRRNRRCRTRSAMLVQLISRLIWTLWSSPSCANQCPQRMFLYFQACSVCLRHGDTSSWTG